MWTWETRRRPRSSRKISNMLRESVLHFFTIDICDLQAFYETADIPDSFQCLCSYVHEKGRKMMVYKYDNAVSLICILHLYAAGTLSPLREMVSVASYVYSENGLALIFTPPTIIARTPLSFFLLFYPEHSFYGLAFFSPRSKKHCCRVFIRAVS